MPAHKNKYGKEIPEDVSEDLVCVSLDSWGTNIDWYWLPALVYQEWIEGSAQFDG